jgi:hypothetical protein
MLDGCARLSVLRSGLSPIRRSKPGRSRFSALFSEGAAMRRWVVRLLIADGIYRLAVRAWVRRRLGI